MLRDKIIRLNTGGTVHDHVPFENGFAAGQAEGAGGENAHYLNEAI